MRVTHATAIFLNDDRHLQCEKVNVKERAIERELACEENPYSIFLNSIYSANQPIGLTLILLASANIMK